MSAEYPVLFDHPGVLFDDARVTFDGERPFAAPDGTVEAAVEPTGSVTIDVTVGDTAP